MCYLPCAGFYPTGVRGGGKVADDDDDDGGTSGDGFVPMGALVKVMRRAVGRLASSSSSSTSSSVFGGRLPEGTRRVAKGIAATGWRITYRRDGTTNHESDRRDRFRSNSEDDLDEVASADSDRRLLVSLSLVSRSSLTTRSSLVAASLRRCVALSLGRSVAASRRFSSTRASG